MKKLPRLILTVATFAAATVATHAADATIERRIARLDGVVHLTAEQKTQAATLFQQEETALAHMKPEDRRPPAVFQISERTTAGIRKMLTPEQLTEYDRTPSARGGGLTLLAPKFRVAQLDREVGLSDDQKKVALQVYTEEFESLLALAPEERESEGLRYTEAARDQIRALLTPEQIAKQDDAQGATIARSNEEITAIEKAVRSSAGLAAHVGSITTLQRQGRSRYANGTRGEARFTATGDRGSEFITAYWERPSATAPLNVTKITDAHGTVIGP